MYFFPWSKVCMPFDIKFMVFSHHLICFSGFCSFSRMLPCSALSLVDLIVISGTLCCPGVTCVALLWPLAISTYAPFALHFDWLIHFYFRGFLQPFAALGCLCGLSLIGSDPQRRCLTKVTLCEVLPPWPPCFCGVFAGCLGLF